VTIVVAALLAAASLITVAPPVEAVSSSIVISQVYGGGGNNGATYTNDFIELYNRGTALADVTGWTVQYASVTGSTWQRTTLYGAIGPKSYYLVAERAGAGGSVALPTPGASGSIAMSATAGKVALVGSDTLLSGTCPAGLLDFVGYGAANCAEGSPTATLSNTTAALRKNGGATDTDNNAADFATGAPNPRNSAPSDAAPSVISTSPADGAASIAGDATLTVTFSEPVNLAASWFTLSCTSSGSHTAIVGGGPSAFTLDPVADFVDDEACTLVVLASAVIDQDGIDPPDAMAADVTVHFSTHDGVAPTATPTTASLRSGIALSGTGLRVNLAWNGGDNAGGSGIASYELSRSLNGGAWTTISASLAASAAALTLASSGRVQFRVRPVDRAGNAGVWAYGAGLAPALVQQTTTAITYQGTWESESTTAYSGGSAKYATATGASATYRFTARSVALVATKGSTRGKVKIYVDGVYAGTTDTYSRTAAYRVQVWSRTWSAAGTHTLKLVVAGTAGRPRVDLDAIALLRAGATTPPDDAGDTPLDLLGRLPTVAEDQTGYDRALFGDWIDADGDGCDTRDEVLIDESVTPVTVGTGCSLTGGSWYSAYDGVSTTNASTFDIDHVVPLKEAWDSGAYGWTADRRQAYANDLDDARSLRAVSASSNRSKSDRDPADWLPPLAGFRCTYATEWVTVKTRWQLTVDSTERTALAGILGSCPGSPVIVVIR
jgi:hypothetical protein